MTLEVRRVSYDEQESSLLVGAIATVAGGALYVNTHAWFPHLVASALVRTGLEVAIDPQLQGERFTPQKLFNNVASAAVASSISTIVGDWVPIVGGFVNCADVYLHGGTPDANTFVTGTVSGYLAQGAARYVRTNLVVPEFFNDPLEIQLAYRGAVEGAAAGVAGQLTNNVLNHTPVADGLFSAGLMGGLSGAATKVFELKRGLYRETSKYPYPMLQRDYSSPQPPPQKLSSTEDHPKTPPAPEPSVPKTSPPPRPEPEVPNSLSFADAVNLYFQQRAEWRNMNP